MQDFVQFGILSDAGFCPTRDIVEFENLSNSGISSNQDFIF